MTVGLASKHDLYYRAYCRVLEDYKNNSDQDAKPLIKKLIIYGIKYINSKKEPEVITRGEAEYSFQFAELIKACMALLTPTELANMFPITKDYDGARWQMKDYFSTMEYLKTLDPDKPIGEKIEGFLWNYTNTEISTFLTNLFNAASDLRRFDTGKGIIEEWADENGIKTYSMHVDGKGRRFLYDRQTGKTISVKPKRHLHIVRKK